MGLSRFTDKVSARFDVLAGSADLENWEERSGRALAAFEDPSHRPRIFERGHSSPRCFLRRSRTSLLYPTSTN